MTQFPYITKADFPAYAQMTLNVDDRFITNAVNDAYNFDVIPVLSDAMMTTIKSALDKTTTWNNSSPYTVNAIVLSDGDYWICLVDNTDSEPTDINTDWHLLEIMSFWKEYIKPYFILSAYSRFLLWHGANITQFGTRQINEDTSVEISDKRRGELISDIKGKINIYLSNLNKYFNSVGGIFDGVTYTKDCGDNTEPTRGGFDIWGVGFKKKKRCEEDY